MLRKTLLAVALIVALVPLDVSAKPKSKSKMRVSNDATRLASILQDVQANINVSSDAWRTVVNEANSLANRIYGNTSGNATARAAARDLRMHVREMRKAALNGDAAGARQHAREALPFAYTLDDWAEK